MTTPERDPNNATYIPRTNQVFDADGQLKPYQQRKYLPSIERLEALGIDAQSRVLDVGVGYGALLSLLQSRGYRHLFGLDPHPESVQMASHYTQADIRAGAIEDDPWPFATDSLDAVTCFDVIEHLETPPVFFTNVARYVRPGGLVLATTPLKELGYRMRGLPWLGRPDRNPTHINVQPPAYWLAAARRSPLELVDHWRGENLTHIKLVHHLKKVTDLLKVDPRRVPLLKQFQQSFIMLMRKPG